MRRISFFFASFLFSASSLKLDRKISNKSDRGVVHIDVLRKRYDQHVHCSHDRHFQRRLNEEYSTR